MLSAARRLPRAVGVSGRLYTTGPKGFSKKEKGEEDQYARSHEMEQLAKLRAQMKAKKNELDRLEKEHKAISNKTTPKA